MESNQSPDPSKNYRAVLIGIDAYTRKPLDGCVNDIDRIQEILLDRLGVPPERITRLAAPHEGTVHSTRIPSSALPTQQGIRDVLERLAEEVGHQDLVFLYYSGHGSQAMTDLNGAIVAREALLPVDHYNPGGAARLLYDFELNGLLSRIAERAGDLTVVLDCCHSASATREDIAPELRNRFCPVEGVQKISPSAVSGPVPKDGAGLAPLNASHLLVAACRACELSWEALSGGVAHGAFTCALAGTLEQAGRPLSELRWADIWTALRDRLAQANAQQNPLIVGRWERRLFGGPWEPRDLGFEIRQDDDRFHIAAGTLADLSPGAELTVYGEEPALFPSFDSDAEKSARIGTIRVEEATKTSAVAISTNGSFHLPAGARARLFRPGEVDRLPVWIHPPVPPEQRSFLEAGGILKVVDEASKSQVQVRADRQGRYHLGDSLYGDGGDPSRPVLFSFPPAASMLTLRRVLEHYADYNRVLLIPRRCTDLPNALSIELLDCADLRGITVENFQAPRIPSLPFDLSHKFQVKEGEGFAISVRNQGPELLHVTVLNCAGSGRIEFLGQAEVKPGALQTLWEDDKLGRPFDPRVATDRASIVDRLVVVGTTLAGQNLAYFAKNLSFAEAINVDRDAGMRGDEKPPVEQWTAALVPLLIQR